MQHVMIAQAGVTSAMPVGSQPTSTVHQNSSITTRHTQTIQPLPNRHIDNEYVGIVPPSTQAVLGEGFKLELTLKEKDVDSVSAIQADWLSPMSTEEGVEESFVNAAVQYMDNGGAYVPIVPLRLGKLRVTLSGVSRSGALFSTSVLLYVDQPAKAPSKLVMVEGLPPNVLIGRLGQSLQDHVGDIIAAEAFYEGFKEPFLIDPYFIRFRFRSSGNQEVIALIIRPAWFVR